MNELADQRLINRYQALLNLIGVLDPDQALLAVRSIAKLWIGTTPKLMHWHKSPG